MRAIGASDIDTRIVLWHKLSLGRLAVQLLLNRLDYPAAAPVRAIIRPALLVRHSVASLSRWAYKGRFFESRLETGILTRKIDD